MKRSMLAVWGCDIADGLLMESRCRELNSYDLYDLIKAISAVGVHGTEEHYNRLIEILREYIK